MIRVLQLGAYTIFFFCLRHPLFHGFRDQFSHIMPQPISILHRVVKRLPVQSVRKEGIKVIVKAFGDELNFSTFNRHHQRCDTCIRDSIDVRLLVVVQYAERAQVPRPTRKVQRCPS